MMSRNIILTLIVLIDVMQFYSTVVWGQYQNRYPYQNRRWDNSWNSRYGGGRPPYRGRRLPYPPYRGENPAYPPYQGQNPAYPPYQGQNPAYPPYQGQNPAYPPYQREQPPYPPYQGQRPPYQGGGGWNPPPGPPPGGPPPPPGGPPSGPPPPPGGPPSGPPPPPSPPANAAVNGPPSGAANPTTETPKKKTNFDLVFSPGLFGLPMVTGFGVNGKLWDPFIQGRYTSNVDILRVGI